MAIWVNCWFVRFSLDDELVVVVVVVVVVSSIVFEDGVICN